MSMLVPDKHSLPEIGSYAHYSSAASPAYRVVTPEGSFLVLIELRAVHDGAMVLLN